MNSFHLIDYLLINEGCSCSVIIRGKVRGKVFMIHMRPYLFIHPSIPLISESVLNA